MNLSFLKIDEAHNAIEFEFASPEEAQTYEKAITSDIPDGWVYAVRKGRSKAGRITATIGLAKVGSPLVLEGDDAGEVKALPPAPVPRSIEVPASVKAANDASLQTMAARHGIDVDNPAWQKPTAQNRKLREIEVAKRMAMSINAGKTAVVAVGV